MSKNKPRCPRCNHPDYVQGVAAGDKRPEFTCVKCNHTWTNGLSGGVYAEWLKARRMKGEKTP